MWIWMSAENVSAGGDWEIQPGLGEAGSGWLVPQFRYQFWCILSGGGFCLHFFSRGRDLDLIYTNIGGDVAENRKFSEGKRIDPY